MGPLLAWRKATLAKLPESDKFSVNDLIVFLVSRALRKHPNINSSWQGDYIAQYNSVHMGVAVALPAGLVTPVVRHSDKLSLVQIAQKNRELIKLARDGKLQPDDYSGGTFTISNLGMSGIEEFTAIINPPQAAILAVGTTMATPVVNDSGDVVVEQRMKVTLSCDHRVIDGAQGAEFLKTLKTFVEDPMSCLFMG
jgi:pyruvate dehydrogenase E2 component (dihydrolipoamide acetyltransferase)